MKKLWLAFFVLNILCCGPLFAQYDEGLVAANRGDFITAHRIWLPLAEAGHIDAQCDLGLMYYKGDGVSQNFSEAIKWFQRAADQGNAKGQHLLALMYFRGRGVSKNNDEAIAWFKKAAEQGDHNSIFNLGHLYATGRKTPEDRIEAYMYFSIAAAQGDEDSLPVLDTLAFEMTPSQIEKAKAKALEWQKNHEEKPK